MLKQNKQNNKSAKVNNIEQVKLEFNNDDLDDNENKIIEQKYTVLNRSILCTVIVCLCILDVILLRF